MDFNLFLGTVAATIFMLLGTILYMVYGKIRVQENKTIVSPPSSFPHNWKHHVFPSFQGADVRKSFLSHIMKEFRSKGIDPFIDNGIERSKSIGPELIEAIRGSRIAIVLLSKNYASSIWCMSELVEIIKCREDLGQIVMTIFYEVDPSDVQKQTGHFGKVFKKTCKGKTKETIDRWRQALAEVATIAGENSSQWENDADMIEKIVSDVSNKLNNSTPSMDFEWLVGMKTHMEKMRPLLRLDLGEVMMIGIWGPPGIGKTTIARFLFSQHSKDFQLSVFMENIKQTCTIPAFYNDYRAKLHLQEQFMSQITNQLGIKIPHLGIAKDRLKDKKVLVVLDDVDQLVQLEAMVKETSWFGPRSRIIITTQDQKLLRAPGINHIYKVDFPSDEKAFQMFCMYAFGHKSPKDGFRELALEVTYLAGKLPLGLQVMGSHFKGMTKEDWSMELPRARASLNKKIEGVLRFSYDALCDEDKKLFLYIACFFNHTKEKKVVGHLAKSFSSVSRGLHVLVEKSLISIEYGVIHMHSLLAQLGKEIVRKQPGKRQFLVDDKDIVEVLTDPTTITTSVIGIDSRDDLNGDMLNISERAFEEMTNLQFLKLDGKTNIASLLGCMKYTSSKLQLLHCEHWPMTSLPSIINVELLVELSMPHSHLEKLWEGIKLLRNLKWIKCSYSKNLKELPNLSTAIDLQELDLSECSSLVELHFSIGNATNLQELDLRGCSSLVELPSSIGNASNLQKLYLRGCSSLLELPSSIGNATNLQELDLRGCSSLVELPSSIGNATNLQKLNLSECSSLVELPSSIGNATNLRELYLCGCSSLVELPSSIGNATNLQKIDLEGCSSLAELSSSIGNATNLQEIYLCGCSSLAELPSSIGNITNLQKIDLEGCSSLVELPSSIGNATNLQELYLCGCSSLVELPFSIGNATNLQKIDLEGCSSLVELPSSIGNATNLQELYLCGCSSLVELPSSIGNAANLQNIDLKGCSCLVELPSSIWNATNLQIIDLKGCSSLVKLPSSIGNATNLEKLSLEECSCLVELPSSIGNATNLQKLSLKRCSSLVELPSSIGNATNLQELCLSECSSLVELPSSIGNATNLQELDLKECSSLVELPSSIGNATNIQKINLAGCSSLVELTSSIGNAINLQKIDLEGCSSLVELPSSIENATNLQVLYLIGCSSLVKLPSSIGNATNLQVLYLSGCSSLVELPSSIGNATNLQKLSFKRCSSLVELPSSIGNATNLQKLCLSGCSSLVELPSSIGSATNLQELYLKGCSSLVELPSSVGNLHRLTKFNLKGCSKLKILPTNINLESLINLNLTNCFLLKSFPEISTNIRFLGLSGTAVEEVPSSVTSWSCLEELHISYSENLKESPHAFDRITELHLTDTRIQELSPWVKELTRLRRLVLNEMQNLVSLSQLPDSMMFLDAENCVSLERLDCSFWNPVIRLNFRNCFKLNQEARGLIIQTSTNQYSVLPGGEVPACFTYRAYGSSVTVNLDEQPLSTSIKFKACILLVNESEDVGQRLVVTCRTTSKQNALTCCRSYDPPVPFSEHLYIFEVEAEEVPSTELVFEFMIKSYPVDGTWKMKECGILELLEQRCGL